MIFTLLEIAGMAFLIHQLAWPLVTDKPTFTFFREKKFENEIAELNQQVKEKGFESEINEIKQQLKE